MRRTIAKIAAAALAVTLTAAALPTAAVMPAYAVTGASTSDESEVEMKAALTKVKQRVTIPKELTEFTYSTGKSFNTKVYNFKWHTKSSAKTSREITVSIVGDIITSYRDSKAYTQYGQNPTFAKLSEKQLLSKAEGYIKQLDPKIASGVKTEISRLELTQNNAVVSFSRYVNGVKVSGNGGTVTLNKDTGELYAFSASWWDNADFPSPKSALTEEEIKAEYKKLCNLTPYYAVSTDWSTGKKTATIVYEPDFTSEINAFLGTPSTIWQDMRNAGGTNYYGYETNYATADDVDEACEDEGDNDSGEGVTFSEAEKKKIQLDKSLLTPEKAFEALKKDKYAALTDDYVISSYDIFSEKSDEPTPLLSEDEASAVNQKEPEEKFYLNISFKVKDELKNTYKGYKYVYVHLNAKTGELISMSKSSTTAKLPKLDVGEANAVAEAAAKQYGGDMYAKCKPAKANSAEVQTWKGGYETSRRFTFDRYVNGIVVRNDRVNVTVDSAGTVTGYSYSWTEDVKFPSAKNILTADKAFDKLYTQRNFDYYYTGWITKEGKVKVYLLYKMDGFYLNAKNGKLCSWNGGEPWEYNDGRTVEYTDIKGIPQEKAILTLQKYGITVTTDSKFKPEQAITKEEFRRLMNNLGGGVYYDVEDIEEEPEIEQTEDANAVKKPDTVTRTDAAVMFAGKYDSNGILKLKGIYKTPFSDVKSSDENIGYIAVAYAKGFIPKGDGKFRGSDTLTRAEAAQMVYDYIKSNKK